MLYQENSTDNSFHKDPEIVEESPTSNQSDIDIRKALTTLENTVLEGVNIPLTDLVLVDANLILDQIEYIQNNLPTALAISIEILQQKQAIIQKATNQAQSILKLAQTEAAQILEESTLLNQAKLEVSRIKLEAEQECEQLRQATYQEIEQWREIATIEYETIQKDADQYANTVLNDLEIKLSQMLTIVQNGRQHLDSPETDE